MLTRPFDVFQAAREAPAAPALVHAQGSLSYLELAQASARAVHWLTRRLGEPSDLRLTGEPVLLLALPNVEQVAMLHALMALGVSVLPVHPRLTDAERTQLLEATGARLLVTPDWYDAKAAVPVAPLPGEFDRERPLALVSTSGTSGRPRLARLSQRAFVAAAEASAERLGWRSEDRWLLALPFAHIGGLSILTRCLGARKTVVLLTREPKPSGAEALAEALVGQRVSLLSLVPTQLAQLLALPDWQAPSHLRLTLVGGAPATPELIEQATARGLRPLPSYGLTEACSQVCSVTPAASSARGGVEAGVGRPLCGVDVRIVAGVIEVRGQTMFSGYWSEPAHAPEEWFTTGDLGHWDAAGCLHVTGRHSDIIISGGENVHPAEVERVVAQVTGHRRIGVYAASDSLWGERLLLAVEGPIDRALVGRISVHLRTHLASFKRPKAMFFVERWPELPSGKLARQLLSACCSGEPLSLD